MKRNFSVSANWQRIGSYRSKDDRCNRKSTQWYFYLVKEQMVTLTFAARLIEEYRKEGKPFLLVLLIPTDTFSIDGQYSLIVSAHWLDPMSPAEAIGEIFNKLSPEDRRKIARVTPIHTSDRFVQDFVANYHVDGSSPLVVHNVTANGYMVEKAVIALSGAGAAAPIKY